MAKAAVTWTNNVRAHAFLEAKGKRDTFGNFSSSPALQHRLRCPMDGNNEDPSIPLKQAKIDKVELLNPTTVLVSFSNGDAVSVETEKVRHLTLTSGSRYVSAKDSSDRD